jgi:predicted amidohydrolase
MMNGALRVAAWQCQPGSLDVHGNLSRLATACARAAADGADVLVTPEMFTSGYDIPADQTRHLAEPADGPTARAVAEITRQTGVAVAYGYPELGPAGEIYNAAQLIDGGRVLGHHLKAHLYGDLDRSRFTPAPGVPAVHTLRGHQVALLICYDVEFPESVRSVALRGAQAVLVPTANMTGAEIVSTVLVRARAYENTCYVAYANYCGAEGGLVYAGLSTICAPDGTVLALADTGEELLVADLSPGDGQSTPYLTDRRGDLFGN